jgi:ribosomal protein S18 acetylase RimI-like enzyme
VPLAGASRLALKRHSRALVAYALLREETAGVKQDVISQQWRGVFENDELSRLHDEGFGNDPSPIDWRRRVTGHSLGWVCARLSGDLVGFVNVAWDGGTHAFLLDTVVATSVRRRGVGTALVMTAVKHATADGCEWLHVDFEEDLAAFYLSACGFRETRAGLVAMSGQPRRGVDPSRR